MSDERFVNVVQRRRFGGLPDPRLMPLVEPLFMIETHMSFEERLALFALTWGLSPGFVVCEVGSYLGASTAFMAAAASLKNGHVHAVDTWHNDAMGIEPVEDTFQRFHDNTKNLRHVITAHRGRACEMKDRIGPLDALFIDGDHSYEGTREHLTNYACKLKPGGTLILHDVDLEEVRRAATDYLQHDPLTPTVQVQTLQAFRRR